MANRIYISILGTDITFVSTCTEDVQVQAQSHFTRIGDFIPSIAALATMLTQFSSTAGGGISSSLLNAKNSLDVPIWQKTEPVKVTTDLNFFIKTSGREDVWKPTMILQSMNILSRTKDNQVITPGFNIKTIGDASKKESSVETGSFAVSSSLTENLNKYAIASFNAKENIPQGSNFSSTSKFCSVYIPAIVYLPIAVVEVVQPTWSKQLSSEGYPIWSKVSVQFTGATPAVFEDNFLSIDPYKLKGYNL